VHCDAKFIALFHTKIIFFFLFSAVPVIVAINKIDRPKVKLVRLGCEDLKFKMFYINHQPGHFLVIKAKVKEQLLSHGLQLEEFGGDVQAVEISALSVSVSYTVNWG
jgi:translation initiation factor IF-2